MAHLGLTPQKVHQLGGFRVQAKSADAASRLLADARELEEAGAFSLVLEAVPAEVARIVTDALGIPTIGIGAGPHCDGQVLVFNDMVGLSSRVPKFVKRFGDLAGDIDRMAREYADDVAEGRFPGPEHSYAADPTAMYGRDAGK
jgi:3-methyl-2-oxobutanoate hydroxymethyltransferase